MCAPSLIGDHSVHCTYFFFGTQNGAPNIKSCRYFFFLLELLDTSIAQFWADSDFPETKAFE